MGPGAPRVGQVVRHSFLWSDGREKERPAVIVLALRAEPVGSWRVAVMPVTHSPPRDPDAAEEIPDALRRHLGLDDERAWVVVGEINEFLWPGFDLRPVPGRSSWEYGQIPPAFHARLLARLQKLRTQGRLAIHRRDE